MFADEIRRQAETASVAALPAVTAALWRAYGEGQITEAEAEVLSELIEARQVSSRSGKNLCGAQVFAAPRGENADPSGISDAEVTIGPSDSARGQQSSRRRSVGSRPRTDASMERRRRWAASGRLPPGLAARFTLAEQAVLALVAAEVARRKDCRLAIENLAAVAGVGRTTVKKALGEARRLGMITVEERQVTGWRNDTNIIRIVSREWLAWLQLARRGVLRFQETPADGVQKRHPVSQGGGVASATTTNTQVLDLGESRKAGPAKSCRGAVVDLDRADPSRIRTDGGRVRAMR